MKVLKRCQKLDQDGKRCKETEAMLRTYHGDPELESGWVAVYLCEEHTGYSKEFSSINPKK